MPHPRSTVAILACLALAPLSARATEPPDWIRDAPAGSAHPEAEALCLRRQVTLELLPDGRCVRRVFSAVKVFHPIPFARTGFADPRVHFDSQNQELRVLQARTWLPSGRARDSGASAKNVIFPEALAQAPDLARFRDMIVTQLGIQKDCVTLFEYEIEDLRPPAWPFEGALEVQLAIPTLETEIVLIVPEETQLEAVPIGPADRRPVVKRRTENGRTRLSFSWKDLPAAPRKSDLIVFGTRSWSELEALLGERRRVLGPLPDALATRLPAPGTDDPLVLADQVSRILQDGLQSVRWPEKKLHFQIRSAERIWLTTYATPFEMACLLASSLERVGLEHVRIHPVFRRQALAVPALTLAEEFWVSTALPGQPPLWIQAGGRPGAPEECALAGASILLGPGPASAENGFGGELALVGELVLAAEGSLAGSFTAELSGSALQGIQAALHGLEAQLRPLAHALGQSRLHAFTIHRLERATASARCSLEGGSLRRGPGGLMRLDLAPPPGSPLRLLEAHPTERHEALQLPGGPRRERIELTLRLPEGWALAAAPPHLERANAIGRVELSHAFQDGALRLCYLLEIRKGRIAPERWLELRELLAPLGAPAAWTLLFEPESPR